MECFGDLLIGGKNISWDMSKNVLECQMKMKKAKSQQNAPLKPRGVELFIEKAPKTLKKWIK